ncbi:MAG TPA: sigma-70 family RNA polymerase sigma factor [Steroidobacteraceae bacterium]|nr:sigma-70 family RNA polymerase sigma factor [Steroidobacteraceae bacterium]
MSTLQSAEQLTLIEQARLGDPVALDRLLATCQPNVRTYARRHCLADDVDDAVQETLLILSKRIRDLKAVKAFAGWLFTVVRRECLRLERRVLFRQSIEEVTEEQLAQRSDATLKLDMIAALESLPAHYLEVVLLRDFAELSILEIAQQLQMEVPGVKSRLHRAREMVREYLVAN